MESVWTRRLMAALVLCLFLVAWGQAKKREDSDQLEQDKQLIERALDKVNIWAAGTPPFRLQASIRVHPEDKGAAAYEGTLVLSWFAPGEWRETINLPEFSQVEIASKGKISVVRNGHHGVRAMEIEHLMDMRRGWTVWADESVVRAKTKKVDGVEAICVEFKSQVPIVMAWQRCADPVSMVPVSLEPGTTDEDSVSYGDYMPWGDRQVPRSIRSFKSGFIATEIKVESMVSNGALAELQLSPSPNSSVSESCDNPEPPGILESYPPHYPETAKMSGRQAREMVYLVVGSDGLGRNLQIVKSDGSDFDAATLKAVSQWKYQPARCGTNPVSSEMIVILSYTLAH